jgi:hypothetical protein
VAQAYVELSRLSYIPHSSLPCAASDSPPVPRTACSRRSFRRRPPIPPLHGPESSSRRPHHTFSHRSPHSSAYACPPEARSLPLETPPPISHLSCRAAFASIANRARSRVPPSICPRRSTLKSQGTRTRHLHGVAAKRGRRPRREDGVETDEGNGRTRARVSACDTCGGRIGFHNCPGVYLTTDIGRGIRWRLTLPPPLPAPPSYLNPRTHPASIPHAHRERKCEQNIHSLGQTAHTDFFPTPILPSRRHARTPRARRHPVPLPPLARASSSSSCLPAHDELQAHVEVRSACACVVRIRIMTPSIVCVA